MRQESMRELADTRSAERAVDRPQGRGIILGSITVSHTVSHFMHQSFLVILPALRDALGIDALQVGALMSVREIASGVSALPGGIVCDRYKRHWGRVMALCLGAFALGWIGVALSANFAVLAAAMMVVAISASVWHLPSMAALSYHYSERRGTALSIYGIGGSAGDVLGPVLTGFMLAYLSWRGVLSLYAAVPLLLALVTLWALRDVGPQEETVRATGGLRVQLRQAVALMRTPALWRINIVSGLHGMCYQIFTTFLPLYLADELGFDAQAIGLHLGLLFTLGIVVSPLFGYLSDRWNRKVILVPLFFTSALLSLGLVFYGRGLALTGIIALLGVALRSDYSILSAAALDLVGHGTATTTLGVLSFTRFAMAALAPLIAGALYDRWGMAPLLYLITGLFMVATLVLLGTRLPKAAAQE